MALPHVQLFKEDKQDGKGPDLFCWQFSVIFPGIAGRTRIFIHFLATLLQHQKYTRPFHAVDFSLRDIQEGSSDHAQRLKSRLASGFLVVGIAKGVQSPCGYPRRAASY